MMFKVAVGLALLICSRLHRFLLLHPKLHRAQVERLVRRPATNYLSQEERVLAVLLKRNSPRLYRQ